MIKFNYVIKDASGMHLRPAGEIVKRAKQYAGEITINGVKATKMLALVQMGIACGDGVEVCVSGENEAEQAKLFEEFLKATI